MRHITIILSLLCTLTAAARIPTDNRKRLTSGWEFVRGDLGNVWEAVREAKPGSSEAVPVWQTVTLPHCFNGLDALNPYENYYQGAGWYRTTIDVSEIGKDERVILEFEGAGQVTDVYLYTEHVAHHRGGYDEWSVDITDIIGKVLGNKDCKERFQGRVPLSVRCSNARDTQLLPSDLSDFTIYGGLYRHVNIVRQPKVSFSNIRIETPLSSSRKQATVRVKADFHDPLHIGRATVSMTMKDAQGRVVKQCPAQQTSTAGGQTLFEFQIAKPQLWSPATPYLYTCELTIDNGQKVTEKVGFRQTEFKEHGPFLLNGERLLLRGTHRHEDAPGVGAAQSDDDIRREMQMIKDMGANFIRLGHYQQSDIVLRLCDSLGILAWEEVPWCRGGLGNETYKNQARRMLKAMIDQHHNHPSIFLWGLGNENDWPNDFPEFNKDSIRAFMAEQHNFVHRYDPSRLTALRRCDFCKDVVDVYSPTLWAGWYAGDLDKYREKSEQARDAVKHFLHVEWGADSHIGRHSEKVMAGEFSNPKNNTEEWSETYAVRVFDYTLSQQETMPWLTGTANWCFKDFATPLRPDNPIPYVNQKGLVGRDLEKKESYYVLQSHWAEKPMLHIYGHSWPTRWGADGEKKAIWVYSNCPAVELFVNGESQGIRYRDAKDYPAMGLRWECSLREGDNEVKAVAVNKGKGKGKASIQPLSDTVMWQYQTATWQQPARLNAYYKDGMVHAEIVDQNGTPCLDAANFITFTACGDVTLVADQGTVRGSRKVQASNGRAAIRVEGNGSWAVAVSCAGLKTVIVNS